MMNCVQNEIQWKPWSLLQQDNSTISNYAIVVLNTPIYWKPEFLSKLWRKGTRCGSSCDGTENDFL